MRLTVQSADRALLVLSLAAVIATITDQVGVDTVCVVPGAVELRLRVALRGFARAADLVRVVTAVLVAVTAQVAGDALARGAAEVAGFTRPVSQLESGKNLNTRKRHSFQLCGRR